MSACVVSVVIDDQDGTEDYSRAGNPCAKMLFSAITSK